MLEQYAAHLRYHFRILKKDWDNRKFSDLEVLEMYQEYLFIKEELGEVKKIE